MQNVTSNRASGWDDRLEIRSLIENWALWRDALQWDRFRTCWHDDGAMHATWFQGSYEDFIAMGREGHAKGMRAFHSLGGTSIDIAGTRAVAQTRMTIVQRAPVEGVVCDVTCIGRFFDLLEKRGRWGLVLRRAIYEQDRLDPVDPATAPKLDRALLERFPVGYRHLAYLQTKLGHSVKPGLPGLDGPATTALYASGDAWLTGASSE